MLVVLQHPELVLGDLRVRGVDVHHVDLLRGYRLVRQAVVEPARRLRQAVSLLQPRPAVVALKELVRQTEPQLGMLGEVADRVQAKSLRFAVEQSKRVGVVESEQHRHAEPERLQPTIERCEVGRLGLEQLARNRSGVVGIEIDASALERFEQDGRVAHALFVNDLAFARSTRCLSRNLAEDVGLGEAFGADDEFVGVGGWL